MGLLGLISGAARRSLLENLADSLASAISYFVREEIESFAAYGEEAFAGRCATERRAELAKDLLNAGLKATE